MSYRDDGLHADAARELEGVLWPWMPCGDDSLPWVERDDESDRFADDINAALHVASLTGTRVMFAALDDELAESGNIEDVLRPFVFPFPDSDTNGPNFNKWVAERNERFGSRRERYDEAMSVQRFPVGTRVRVKQGRNEVYAGEVGVVSGLEDSSRWVVLDGHREGKIFNANQLENEGE